VKDQYFGDVNDYRKYGLLRVLVRASGLRLLVSWMLTPDDGGSDGGFRRYLQEPCSLRACDPVLFDALADLTSGPTRAVSLIEASGLLPHATFFRDFVPDDRLGRARFGSRLVAASADADLVFLDPDNGIEVASKPVGYRGSSKYVAWKELDALWAVGKSLLIYQHFPRRQRAAFSSALSAHFQARTSAPYLNAFRTPHVLFVLVAQAAHQAALAASTRDGLEAWRGQIGTSGLHVG
jgi:hypothetical protein